MPEYLAGRLFVASLLVAVISLPMAAVNAQAKKQSKQSKAAVSPLFVEAMGRAKASKQPLVMFGVSPGCSRCAALKEGLTAEPEIKELMTQYVSADIPFGGKEFSTVFNDIIRQDKKYGQAIGAPSIFIFTSQGAVVYAGPNEPNGMQPNEAFKKLLKEGIEKNGGSKGAKGGGK